MNPMRQRASCPDCGLVIDRSGRCGGDFDCQRCQAHYSHYDFWEENEEKWKAQYTRRATMKEEE